MFHREYYQIFWLSFIKFWLNLVPQGFADGARCKCEWKSRWICNVCVNWSELLIIYECVIVPSEFLPLFWRLSIVCLSQFEHTFSFVFCRGELCLVEYIGICVGSRWRLLPSQWAALKHKHTDPHLYWKFLIIVMQSSLCKKRRIFSWIFRCASIS